MPTDPPFIDPAAIGAAASAATAIDLPDLEATERLGLQLGRLLRPGCTVALVGDLGAGKTHLSRALAVGLGVDARRVTSPTFVLLQEYAGAVPVYHFDTYRLPGPAAFADLEAGDYLGGDGVCLVEWADRVAGQLPADLLRIHLAVTGPTSRHATLLATGPRHARILEELAAAPPQPAAKAGIEPRALDGGATRDEPRSGTG